MNRKQWLAMAAGLLLIDALAFGQGVLVVEDPHQYVRLPRPTPLPHPTPQPATYKIKGLEVHARLLDSVAQVQVAQTFVNTGTVPLEVSFVFPLPYDGAVERLTFMVDGQEIPAQLLDAAAARSLYEAIVRKNRDPALLEWMGTGLFKTSVFPVPPGAERKVSLRYSQLCRKDHGLTDFIFPLSTAKYTSHPVETVAVRLAVESSSPIKNVYSPTHSIEIQRPDERHANVSFTSTNQVPSSDFRLFFDTGTGELGARVLSFRPDQKQDGFFLLLASPQIKAADEERPKKTVVFVVDRSGSMSGEKIEQAKGALKFVLNNLRAGDLFNVIVYDDKVESFRPELQRFDEDTRKAALGFVEGIYAGGSTNIDAALATALQQLKDATRPNYVIFLTDGLPTTGERNEMKIVENSKELNKVHARVFTFGVGYDVNSHLLDKLVRENFGQSEYVRPNEDIEAHVSRLYSRIGSPVMTDIGIKFALDHAKSEAAAPINRVFPRNAFDLFEGEQLIVVGRYREFGAAKVAITGSVGGKQQTSDFPAELVEHSHDDSYGFVEKLWAVRRIGDIIDELDLKGQNEELVKELVQLSTQHGILTPYTSFLANENVNIRDLAANTVRTRENTQALLAEPAGRGGVAQRASKGDYQRAETPVSFGGGGNTAPAAKVRDADDREVLVDGVCNLGNKAFYSRNQTWIDSTITDEMEKNAIRVVQFSDDYFKLAERHGRKLAQYLVFDDPVLVNVAGTCYRIEPAKQ
ncbi:MAG TPA: VIT domain-containing protein [Phycisphaerae bacterium]|jgi:Ca-activated chloride channel family protein